MMSASSTSTGSMSVPAIKRGATIDEIVREIEATRIPERSGRAMDHESEDAFERLRTAGYL